MRGSGPVPDIDHIAQIQPEWAAARDAEVGPWKQDRAFFATGTTGPPSRLAGVSRGIVVERRGV
jgi:hypothetical protein